MRAERRQTRNEPNKTQQVAVASATPLLPARKVRSLAHVENAPEHSCAVTLPSASCNCEAQPLHLRLGRVLQLRGEAQHTQQPHGVPREVDLPPLQAVPAGGLE
eukprot:CAMPEP_0179040524 /NCGR_PEP_ID=MMETSP0796-20121207/15691_1 /TAXON_ID=73915 /ORGANISM="Pyrodinium bahamense, Strain pbaha01" /LENGTH=103 /DNA_ID=CAMNT_0020736871 /DNA_START=337 /DNA_END=644 /DNA_ORIENTATION=+